jgi:hypothetical protein
MPDEFSGKVALYDGLEGRVIETSDALQECLADGNRWEVLVPRKEGGEWGEIEPVETEDVEERVMNETSVVIEEDIKSRGCFGTVLKGAYFRSKLCMVNGEQVARDVVLR